MQSKESKENKKRKEVIEEEPSMKEPEYKRRSTDARSKAILSSDDESDQMHAIEHKRRSTDTGSKAILSSDDESEHMHATVSEEGSTSLEVSQDDRYDSDEVCGSGLLTFRSVGSCIGLIKQFLNLSYSDMNSSFMSCLWTPIWDILKDQGDPGKDLKWKHSRCFKTLGPTWCFVPPNSNGVKTGIEGKDFFCSERDLVMRVCSELRTISPHHFSEDELKTSEKAINPSPKTISRRSVYSSKKRNIVNEETTLSKPKKKSRVTKKVIELKTKSTKGTKRHKKGVKDKVVKQKSQVIVTPGKTQSLVTPVDEEKTKIVKNNVTSDEKQYPILFSQTALEGATNLLSLLHKPTIEGTSDRTIEEPTPPKVLVNTGNNLNASEEKGSMVKGPSISQKRVRLQPTHLTSPIDRDLGYHQIEGTENFVTEKGVASVCQMRRNAYKRFLKKEKMTSPNSVSRSTELSKSTLHSKSRDHSEKQISEGAIQNFHLTQSPIKEYEQLNPSSFHQRKTSQSENLRADLPLFGLTFFYSGCENIEMFSSKILDLGGTIVTNLNARIFSNRNKMTGNLFFISRPSCRRRLKYIFAAALGVPMLHFNWIDEIVRQNQIFKQGKADGKKPNPFDSALYDAMRLPCGLCLSSGLFPLQRARHARMWTPPGAEDGNEPVFHGMGLTVVLEDEGKIKDWARVIKALGATFISIASFLKGNNLKQPDAIIVDRISFPPHSTAVHPSISKVLNFAKNDIPVIDLSWIVQCIVQRKRVEFIDNKRYCVQYKNNNSSSNAFLIKVDQNNVAVRYEVGDTVMIKQKEREKTAYARVTGMKIGRNNNNLLQIQFLEHDMNFGLIDGGCSTSTATIDESQLHSHIILLSPKDFRSVSNGYISKKPDSSDIFMQKKRRT